MGFSCEHFLKGGVIASERDNSSAIFCKHEWKSIIGLSAQRTLDDNPRLTMMNATVKKPVGPCEL